MTAATCIKCGCDDWYTYADGSRTCRCCRTRRQAGRPRCNEPPDIDWLRDDTEPDDDELPDPEVLETLAELYASHD